MVINNYAELKIKGRSAGKVDYMKAKTKRGKVFYGSTLNNNFYCTSSITNILSDFYVEDGQICEFAGWLGDDSYEVDDDTNDYIIKDFVKNIIFNKTTKQEQVITSKDKILIDNDLDLVTPYYGNINGLIIYYDGFTKSVKITLEGVSEGDVKGWLEVAKLNPKTDSYYDEKKQKLYIGDDIKYLKDENPIKIE